MKCSVLVIVMVCAISVECKKKPSNEEGRRDRWALNPALQRTTLPVRAGGPIHAGKVDPVFAKLSWESFQKANLLSERKERRKKKAMRQLRTGSFHSRAAIGPPGQRGPAGPRGPKGANVTKEEIFEEFRALVHELTQRKLLIGADPRCTELCVSNLKGNITGPVAQLPLFGDDQDLLVPKIASSFMWELKEYTNVPKHSRIELDMFVPSHRPGAYGRGTESSKADTGRFVAPRTGFYNFNVRIHLQLPIRKNNEIIPGSELFSISICIDGSCRAKMMLETISGFGPGDRMTIPINGMLHLKINEYVSVFIDNPSKHDLEAFDGSQFSGYLLGI